MPLGTQAKGRAEAGARARRATCDALQHVLGNTCQLMASTTSFRWNVVGPSAPQLQALFAAQGEEMSGGIEDVAQRIRALGAPAIANYADEVVVPLASAPGALPMPEQMTGLLAQGHDAMRRALEAAGDVASEGEDAATALLLARRLLAHEAHAAHLKILTA